MKTNILKIYHALRHPFNILPCVSTVLGAQ